MSIGRQGGWDGQNGSTSLGWIELDRKSGPVHQREDEIGIIF